MPERRQTRAQARAAEELSFQVKREEQQTVRQAQQRAAARQRREAADDRLLTIDIRQNDITAAVTPAAAAAAPSYAALADELPPLEEAKASEAGALTAATVETVATAMTVEQLLLHMPSLDAPAALDAVMKQELKDVAKDEADGGVSEQQPAVSGEEAVKAESSATKMEEEKKEGENAAGGRYLLRPRQAAVPAQVQRRSRRARPAPQHPQEDDSDGESDFAASGGDGSDDDDDDEDEDEEAGDSRDAAIVIGSEQEDDELNEDVSLMQLQAASSPPVPLSSAEAAQMFSSTDPAAFIAPFLSFSPPASISYDDRYCLTLAVSSRSRCRQCRQLIHTGYPRIGQHARIRCHLITRWYHPSCAVLAFAPTLGSLDRRSRDELVDGKQGRLDSVRQYEELLQLLNARDGNRWRTTMESLDRRRREIEDWHRTAGGDTETQVRERKKRRKNKKRKTERQRAVEEQKEAEEEEQQEEEKVAEEPTVKSEARVKRERRGAAAVKREPETKLEPGLKTERGARVKRERPATVKEEEEEEEEEKKAEDAAADGGSRRSKRRRQQ